jgi:putative polyhydroxyalkanoate system protein
MSNVHVIEAHTLPLETAKQKLSSFEEMLKKYMLSIEWNGYSAQIKGPVSGSISLTATQVEVEIKLGMMAKMMGIDPERLSNSIRKRLKENLV